MHYIFKKNLDCNSNCVLADQKIYVKGHKWGYIYKRQSVNIPKMSANENQAIITHCAQMY